MNTISKTQTILITGASGMIGSATVEALLHEGYTVIGIDRRESALTTANYKHHTIDLTDKATLEALISSNNVDRIIHLAALAHSAKGQKFSWDDYYQINVTCAKNVFEAAGQLPVLFISTVDVYGFTKGVVAAEAELNPVSHYAKSKVMAEKECRKNENYDIFRFSPVYTDDIKRDIQKRYYLKYPSIAYTVGRGMEYEVLNIKNAVSAMVNWCNGTVSNSVRIIKDSILLNTADCIKNEKAEGRAKITIRIPRWIATSIYSIAKTITGRNKYTYLLNKAINPLRTE